MLVGVVDPSHKERASDTMGRLPNWLPLDEALEASANPKWAPWTQPLLRAMFAEHQERDYISTSTLVTHCPRAEVIKRKFDYVDDLSSMYVPFRGTAVHTLMEKYAGPDDIPEARFWTEIDGVEISCSPDLITADGGLYDYKVSENPPMYNSPYRNHTEQVQVNAFIVRNRTRWQGSGFAGGEAVPDITRLGLVYMGPKQPKVLMVEETQDYFDFAKGKDVRGKQPAVWSDERVLDLILPRLEMMELALHSPYVEKAGEPLKMLAPLGMADLWGGDDTFRCPGAPLCLLPNCLAKRYPDRLIWDREDA